MRRFLAAAFGAALTLSGLGGGAAPAAAQETTTLKISHYLPAGHGFQTDFLGPWAAELEQRTNGRVKAEIFPGTSSFGNAARQADQVRAGVIDIALGLRGIPRGRFERSSVFELPFVVSDAGAGTRAMWAMPRIELSNDTNAINAMRMAPTFKQISKPSLVPRVIASMELS